MNSDGKIIISIAVKLETSKTRLLFYLPATVLIMDLRSGATEKQEPLRATARSTLESQVAFFLERSKSIQSRLHKICGPNETAYLDNLCARFIKENCKEEIGTHISNLDKLQVSIHKYENKVIALSGIGSAYEIVNGIAKEVRTVLGNLEDIFCAALIGVEEVGNMRSAGKFLYQTGGDGR